MCSPVTLVGCASFCKSKLCLANPFSERAAPAEDISDNLGARLGSMSPGGVERTFVPTPGDASHCLVMVASREGKSATPWVDSGLRVGSPSTTQGRGPGRHIGDQVTPCRDQGKKRHVRAKSLQSCPTPATPWTVAHQAPLSMGFSRQKHWSGVPFPPPGGLLNPGIESRPPALKADSLYQLNHERNRISKAESRPSPIETLSFPENSPGVGCSFPAS